MHPIALAIEKKKEPERNNVLKLRDLRSGHGKRIEREM